MPTLDQFLEFLRNEIIWVTETQTGRMLGLAAVLVYLVVWMRILARAGFPLTLAFLMLVPPLALAVWIFLSIAPWPARRELAALRKVQRVMHDAEQRRLIA